MRTVKPNLKTKNMLLLASLCFKGKNACQGRSPWFLPSWTQTLNLGFMLELPGAVWSWQGQDSGTPRTDNSSLYCVGL